ncbi:hypothetical protein ES705_34664 [subsurface metagenome]
MTGSGTLLDPYVIWDVNDLQAMENDLTAYYELANDIDASATVGWNGGLGFDPVGNRGGSPPDPLRFSGYFNGKGHIISDLFINRPLERFVGLFGITAYGVTGYIRNVGIVDCNITGQREVGALVGFHEWMIADTDGVISNCYSTGSITGDRWLIGGLLGYNGALVEDCYSTCDLTISSVTSDITQNGGLIGYNDNKVVRRCYATGDITVNGANAKDISMIGGLVGMNGNGHGLISQCFATGNLIITSHVTGDDTQMIGGLIGFNTGDGCSNSYARGNVSVTPGIDKQKQVGGLVGYNDKAILNCYSTGLVTAPGFGFVGGLVGETDWTPGWGSVTDSFWDTEASETLISDGGTGKTTTEMKTTSTFTDAGWDFDSIWTINPACNNGYPCLLGVTPSCTKVPAIPFVINKSYALAREEL